MPQVIWYTLDEFFEFDTIPETIVDCYLSTEIDRDFNGQTVYAINVRYKLNDDDGYNWVMDHVRTYFREHNGDEFIREFPAEIIY